ncbi:methyltransferase, FkbM family [Halomonas saccharevitans]|uniref:protein O-GlcNAc transferase n=2 Tax=Halomonas saccharevitans TaxID=416872 RepID=A0A1I6YYR8_9GAMM|nr:methyltransferase, FkbM family [Halomonas saccharevitans]
MEAQARAPEDAEVLALQGRITHQLGDPDQALVRLKQALELSPGYAKAHHYVGYIYYTQSRFDQALEHAERACELVQDDVDMLNTLGNVLLQRFEYERARDVLEKAANLAPDNYLSWNNLGNVHNALGNLDAGLDSYHRAHRAAPSAPGPFSNLITTCHYHPSKSAVEITALCKQWHDTFPPARPKSTFNIERVADKRLRIGLISDGFRGHPVGRMITSALEQVAPEQMALFFYSTNNVSDGITERLKAIAERWMSVQPMKDAQVTEQVRHDEIDILIDLAGHNAGNRVMAVADRLAPLQVKWVGGLINTTGVEAIDYLISDAIETPAGVDGDYVEKLIRLPDDYICYVPPNGYEPSVQPLPALENGYITLGCFNNATKLNDVVLEQWAGIMHALPGSRLFLKSMQYQSQERCRQIRDTMASHGVDHERLIIEGPSSHVDLLDAYNRVDIALDPWPYSGGLTTCEAFLMGVPVVTLPGPTFAGRHSATHLANAGMPELVVHSWEEYRERALELASDLESLSIIRQHLRQILLESPVCDAPRFARHFTTAMRAIWQRYCEGKSPAALTFDEAGQATFDGDSQPVALVEPEVMESDEGRFRWSFTGKVIVLDNGAKLMQRSAGIYGLLKLGAFGVVAFDSASRVTNPERFATSEDVQLLPHAALGDGQPATLYATLDPAASATLEPLPAERLSPEQAQSTRVVTTLPVNTVTLDSIEGLDSLDWLVLDDRHDAMAILEHGEQALKDTLLLQVRLAFQPTHQHQPDFAQVSHWASRHGFRFYRFNDEHHRSQLSDDVPANHRQATELESADALFLPSYERMTTLSENQRTKLAFILDVVFRAKDVAHDVLHAVSPETAKRYMAYSTQDKLHQASRSEKSSDQSVTGGGHRHAASATPRLNVSYDWRLNEKIHVVDIGANPIDGEPPYKAHLDRGMVSLVGFEPQRQALAKLNAMKGPNELYLPYAVGDGKPTRLYLCQAPGMTSTLKPNTTLLNHFQGYPLWGKVNQVEVVDTVRLDDLGEVGQIDWLKIDIQGGELTVFQNAEKKLKDTLVIQTEVNFIHLYENQPLFAETDQWMRDHGFMLHTLLEERKRLYAPMVLGGQIHQGINQLTTADAVYIPTFERMETLGCNALKKLGVIVGEVYQSHDLAMKIAVLFEKKFGGSAASIMGMEGEGSNSSASKPPISHMGS